MRSGSVNTSRARARSSAIAVAEARCAYRSWPNEVSTRTTTAAASTHRCTDCAARERRAGSVTNSARIDAVIIAVTITATVVTAASNAVTST